MLKYFKSLDHFRLQKCLHNFLLDLADGVLVIAIVNTRTPKSCHLVTTWGRGMAKVLNNT